MSLPIPLTPAERFAQIVATMVGMIGARLERPGKPGLAGPLTFAIHLRLQGIRNRITRYVTRWQAGTLTPPRPRTRPAAPRPRRASPGKWDHFHLPKLPRERMWLVRLVPGIGVGANHLRILLDDPDMAAMMRAAPQIGRTLRPFWHMLSPDPLPPLLQRPRPAPAAPVVERVSPERGPNDARQPSPAGGSGERTTGACLRLPPPLAAEGRSEGLAHPAGRPPAHKTA